MEFQKLALQNKNNDFEQMTEIEWLRKEIELLRKQIEETRSIIKQQQNKIENHDEINEKLNK